MWSPTHVQVTVQKAWGLLTKGNHNTNDCFVTIALGKVKYQTSVKLKSGSSVEWHEECELPIPDQGNTAEIILTVLHRNFLGVDEFLGRVNIPLSDFDVYERPRNRWYPLQSKVGKENKKERGELEVKIAFTVKAGSLTDLSKKDKHKSSMGQLSQVAQSVGGSLLSIGSLEKRKGLKKFAKSIGSKINIKHKKKDSDDLSTGSMNSLKRRTGTFENVLSSKQVPGDADPGVVSEDEDEFTFDDLSHNSSTSSLNHSSSNNTNNATQSLEKTSTVGSLENLAGGEVLRRHTVAAPPKKPPRFDYKPVDEWEVKLYGKSGKNFHGNGDTLNRIQWDPSKLSSQIEEEEPQDVAVPDVSEPAKSEAKNKKEVKKEEKDDRIFSKLKNFRKEKSTVEKQETIEKVEKVEKVEKAESPSKANEMSERIIIGGENEIKSSPTSNRPMNEVLQKFNGKTREDLIVALCELQSDLDVHKKKLKDLEDYLDDLLLRVMETTPRILQNPYVGCEVTHSDYRSYQK